eukprot:s5_g9.t1
MLDQGHSALVEAASLHSLRRASGALRKAGCEGSVWAHFAARLAELPSSELDEDDSHALAWLADDLHALRGRLPQNSITDAWVGLATAALGAKGPRGSADLATKLVAAPAPPKQRDILDEGVRSTLRRGAESCEELPPKKVSLLLNAAARFQELQRGSPLPEDDEEDKKEAAEECVTELPSHSEDSQAYSDDFDEGEPQPASPAPASSSGGGVVRRRGFGEGRRQAQAVQEDEDNYSDNFEDDTSKDPCLRLVRRLFLITLPKVSVPGATGGGGEAAHPAIDSELALL